MPPNTISVARPGRYGNPHRIGFCPVCGANHTRAEAVAELRAEIEADAMLRILIRQELCGRDLACWCSLDEPDCHAELLLAVANGAGQPSARKEI